MACLVRSRRPASPIRAFLTRLPGWNPEALWTDDLVYGAIVRSEDVWNMLTAPIQVVPNP